MRKNARTGAIAFGIAAAMLGAAYASVPLYRLFCQVTGFAGTTQVASADTVVEETGVELGIRFDANVAPGMGWDFKPVQVRDRLKIGERKMAFFQATNTNDYPVTGTAVFNVSPDTAGKYFNKIQCFCFTEQTLQPGQTASMPVSYYVDPAILDDPSGKRIDEITLSYTFFPAREQTASKPATDTRG